MKSIVSAAFIFAFAHSASAVEYAQIKSIFSQKCYACHAVSKGKTKGDLALDTLEKLAEVIKPGGQIVPGDPAKSSLLTSCKLPDDDDDSMPPKGKNRLTPAEITALETWIKEGAFTGSGPAPMVAPTAPAAAATPTAGGVQSWTSNDGKAIQATFMGLQGDGVLLKMAANNEVFLVPLARLSPESQAQAKAAK
jgi:hypothetical protein